MLRYLFYLLIVKPLVLVVLGINARGREHLPQHGPAILVANHNSHLDALALMSLFPQAMIGDVHPVAAADYFCKNRCLKWLAINVAGIIPIDRNSQASSRDVLAPIYQALDNHKILIFFPEGTRGEPENLGKMKNGIASIIAERSHVPVVPVFFYGLGKALPKGEVILVPFFIDAFIDQPIHWLGNRQEFMANLKRAMADLQAKAIRLKNDLED
ncbi:MAG: 1-acyl-sn-glycerol-3-phosphate acyltransferase [Methylococcaceae bacterium]|nr:1-acyl-sn-glycerol-3-phosphate acyltransferase [Methylococcaceae bacterium]